MEKTDISAQLIQYKDSMDLRGIVSVLKTNEKSLSKREAKVYSAVSFSRIKKYISEGFISNDMNREEELDDKKSYRNKISHAIRFIDGISAESHLQLSLIPHKGEILYISDDGTMMSLCFGQFFNSKKLTGLEIEELLLEIKENYKLDGKEVFFNSIRDWIGDMNELLKGVTYSLNDIITHTKTQAYYDDTTINYEINLFDTKLHIKDQQNANLQPNPWIAHNFYKSPVKALDTYKGPKGTFLGNELQNEFAKVKGVGCDPNRQDDRLFRTYCKNAKKAEMEIPFYTTKAALLNVEEFKQILEFNKYFIDHSKHEDKEIGNFWYKSYESMVTNVKYTEMIEHIEDFKLVYENDWKKIKVKIDDLLGNTSCAAFDDFTPFKDDFSMYIIFVILGLHKIRPAAFSRTPSSNITRIKKAIIDEIINKLDSEVSDDDNPGKTIKLVDLFNKDGYRNWKSRFELVWEPAIKQVYTSMQTKSKKEAVFDREIEHQKEKIRDIIRRNEWGSRYICCSHQTDEILKIDFNDATKTMAGLHCVPVDSGGTASDGVIWGLTADNEGDWKFKNLNELFDNPSDYWRSLGNRNEDVLNRKGEELSDLEKKAIRKFVLLCEEIAMEEINYLKKA